MCVFMMLNPRRFKQSVVAQCVTHSFILRVCTAVAPWKARSETLLMLLNDRSTVVKLGDLGNALSRRTEIRFLEMSSCRPLGQGMEMILVHHM